MGNELPDLGSLTDCFVTINGKRAMLVTFDDDSYGMSPIRSFVTEIKAVANPSLPSRVVFNHLGDNDAILEYNLVWFEL